MNIGNALYTLPYKIRPLVATTRPTSICSPETYYDTEIHSRMLQRRHHVDHKWIFDLLAGQAKDEEIFVDNKQWMLCRDRHIGPEDRYLVVFKDTSLYTLRELNSTHLPMLVQVQNACRQFLRETYQNDAYTKHTWRLYFNYMPSVMQLHLHVARFTSHCSTRIQPLGCVIRNIRENPAYYASALIMMCSNKPAEHSRMRYRPANACTHDDSSACVRNGCWRDARRRPPQPSASSQIRPLRANPRSRARTYAC